MDADITIIGGGVVGLAVAAELADDGRSIFLLDKNETHGREISSRNSEVIHAGIYYPPGSLKALLCVRGREILYEICRKHNVPHRRIGKLIIAATDREVPMLEHLLDNALQNGVTCEFLEKNMVGKMEPHVAAAGALFSPDTGILSVHSLMDYYLQSAKSGGVEIVCGTRVAGIEKLDSGYKISTVNMAGEVFDFLSEKVVNSAGLQSDVIAGMVGMEYHLHYCKGDYFSIGNVRRGLVDRLVYPLPEAEHVGLGIHLTLDLAGRMRLGPDATYIEKIEDYKVDPSKRDRYYEAAVRYLPFVRREDIVPDMAGIRPKLQGPGERFCDFVIREDLPGFINLVGIESPGLTAAPAIAEYVAKLLMLP